MSSPDYKWVPHVSTLRHGKKHRGLLAAVAVFFAAFTAHADLPPFLQHVVGASSIEAALYRLMPTPAGDLLYPRPPAEASAQLTTLLAGTPTPELHALRGRAEEQAMNYPAAEADWKAFAAQAKDTLSAKQELADYFEHRQQIPQELAVLAELAAFPVPASEMYLNPAEQRPWKASTRALTIIRNQGLSAAVEDAAWATFLRRYPAQPNLYARYLNVLLARSDYLAAEALIGRLRSELPTDLDLQFQAEAALAERRGNPDAALAVYNRGFNPLWPAPVLDHFFQLLNRTHRLHQFLAEAQTRLAAHPDDLEASARIFLFYAQGTQAAGSETDEASSPRLQAARETLARYRISKEARNAAWTPFELSTLASLSLGIHDFAEAARYDYALAAAPGTLPGGESAAQSGLAALTSVLLSAPDQPIALGAGNLTLYRDMATLDQGPGYWNGILSLWLNGTDPAGEYATESGKAQPWFHRAKAAELLDRLDHDFPAAPERAPLHLQLLQATAQYGDPSATIAAGKVFLTAFPQAAGRVDVANLIADAYARQQDLSSEFALYEATLSELAEKAGGQPLSAAGKPEKTDAEESAEATPSADGSAGGISPPAPVRPRSPQTEAAAAYAQVLDRYLARLTAANRLPEALAVLRRQLDHHPDDPLLYERLATFLEQNNLSAQQEAVYKLAMERFPGVTWQDRLGRFYLKQKRSTDFAELTRQVTQIFSGTELDGWFGKISPGSRSIGPELSLQLNLYAAQRFPHDLVFLRNLLNAYARKPTANPAALDALLRGHWWESPELRDRFFEHLTRTGKMDAELAVLTPPGAPQPRSAATLVEAATRNPAALEEQAEALAWRSRFEEAAPRMAALSYVYPANAELGDRAISLYRSLAYQNPAQTAEAAAIEKRLLLAEPDSPERLATLGDLYAEATATGGEDLAAAAPYWQCIPQLHPGSPAGYLTAATIFWDYFQFDDALAEIGQARRHFAAPALYGYEAGAIEENRHDLPAAVREYLSAVIESSGSLFSYHATPEDDSGKDAARARLLELAARPATAGLVDQATANALSVHTPSMHPGTVALNLRVDVLIAESRQSELGVTLSAALSAVTTQEQAAAIGTVAQTHGLTPVYEAALTREAALTLDPIEKIQLEFALARSQEERKDIPAAGRTVAAVYTTNPKLLGVVRTTVDFYTRTHQPALAVTTLLNAAQAATPQLADTFTLEAAADANTAGNFPQARSLADGLLRKSPYDARYLAVDADSYALAHDDAGLKAFYLNRLDLIRTGSAQGSPVPDRKAAVAVLRRGLIPALTRLGDYAGAEDQYIALISAYPEDPATGNQAALYALAHAREPQLLSFLRTTVASSPRDARFSILLAQAETTFGDLPAAISAYAAAIAIRSDRADLYTARAGLALRVALTEPDAGTADRQMDAVAQDYTRLYTLSYHDPAWMVRVAELRARQKRPAEAALALETAYLTGRPQRGDQAVHRIFQVASQLERWNLLPQALTYAERGKTLAGDAFLTDPSLLIAPEADSSDSGEEETATPATSSDASVYARILARQGHPEQALDVLLASRRQADAATPSLLTGLYQSLADGDSPEARKDLAVKRSTSLQAALAAAVDSLGEAVGTYATPEAKSRFAAALDLQHAAHPRIAISAAHAAGLFDREALWRQQALLAARPDRQNLQAYIALETSRLQFSELARTLELYAKKVKPEQAKSLSRQAARAYGSAGDPASELRITRTLALASDPALRDRFLGLLLRHDPAALQTLAAGTDATLADSAADYALAHGSEQQALDAVGAHGRALTPVWLAANTALTGLSFTSVSHAADTATDASFRQALGADATIAERVGQPVDAARQLTGENWFPYAASYAVFRFAAPGHGDPEDFAAAQLENSLMRTPEVYTELAETYGEAGKIDAALAEEAHALELDPADAALLDAEASLLAGAGRTPEALEAWRKALNLLAEQAAGQHTVSESFWTAFRLVLQHLGERHLAAQFAPQIESIVQPYLNRNGNYRSNELLQQVYTASQSTDLLLACVNGAPQEDSILADLAGTPLSPEQDLALYRNASRDIVDLPHEAILRRRIELAKQHPAASADSSAPPDSQATTPATLQSLEARLIRLELDRNQLPAAAALQAGLQPGKGSDLEETRIEIDTRNGQLPSLIAEWIAQPGGAPEQATLERALTRLERSTPFYTPQPAQLRPLLEYRFNRKRLDDTLDSTDFLAMAQNDLDSGNLHGAIDLLHQSILQPVDSRSAVSMSADPGVSEMDMSNLNGDPDPTANLDAAARLLEKTGHPAEAVPFLALLVRDTPWNTTYRLRLGQAQLALGNPSGLTSASTTLQAVASDPQAAYSTRVAAAEVLGKSGSHPATLGSGELDLLAAGHAPTPAAASQPYFAAARMAAASADPERLVSEAIAIDPEGKTAPEARLRLLTSLLDANRTERALAVMTGAPMQNSYPADESGQIYAEGSSARLPGYAAAKPVEVRIHLARQLGLAEARSGEPARALPWFRLAQDLTPAASAGEQAFLRRQILQLLAQEERQRRNALRLPVLRETLGAPLTSGPPSAPVRPRLIAATGPHPAVSVPASQENP